MSQCPKKCPACGGVEFYLMPVGDRWICNRCEPYGAPVAVRLVWLR